MTEIEYNLPEPIELPDDSPYSEKDHHLVASPTEAPEAERCMIGGLLQDPAQIVRVARQMSSEDFLDWRHKLVAETIHAIHARGEFADFVTLTTELDKTGNLEKIGGEPFLLSLIEVTPGAAYVEQYARQVAEAAVNRRLQTVGTAINGLASNPGNVDEKIAKAAALLRDVSTKRQQRKFGKIKDPTPELKEMGAWSIPMHIQGFDDILRLVSGKIHMVVGNPGSGKTTLALHVAFQNAMNNVPSYVFLSENDTVDGRLALLAQYEHVPAHILSKLQYDPKWRTEENIRKFVTEAWESFIPEGVPLYLVDRQGATTDDIVGDIQGLEKSLIVIDHAYAFVHQGMNEDSGGWASNPFVNFYKKLMANAAKDDNLVLMLNQYTKVGTSNWREAHTAYGGVAAHNVACTDIHLHRESDFDFRHIKAVVWRVVKSKAKLVTKFNEFGTEVPVDPDGREGIFYIDTDTRSIRDKLPQETS